MTDDPKPKPKRAFRGLAGSPLAEVDYSAPLIDKPIPLPTPEESEQVIAERGGIEIRVKSNRYIFAPPMSVVNVAIFLTMPQVLYVGYEKNKNNPPAESRPTFRPIQTDAIPPKQRRGKLPVPPELYQDLSRVKDELSTTLSAKHSKKVGGMTGQELTRARRLKRAEKKRIEDKIASYENWTKIDIPNTGRPSFTVEIPSCPKGCDLFFQNRALKKSVCDYIRAAWGMEAFDNPASWDHHYADFENQVIRQAVLVNVFCAYPNEMARLKLIEDPNYVISEVLSHEETAAGKALSGYTASARRELDDFLSDEGRIRVVRPDGFGPHHEDDSSSEEPNLAGGADGDPGTFEN